MFNLASTDIWYLTRASALVGYFLLWVSIFLGLAIRTPILKKIIKPIYSFQMHCWISLQAVFFAGLHGIFLLFDKYVGFGWSNILIPYCPTEKVNVQFLALGIIGFYVMIILVLTSYLRKYISQTIWRGLHFLNIGLFVIVFIHALFLGTDLKSGILREIFIYANTVLAVLFIINIFSRLFNSNSNNDENIRQSESSVIEERGSEDFRGRI